MGGGTGDTPAVFAVPVTLGAPALATEIQKRGGLLSDAGGEIGISNPQRGPRGMLEAVQNILTSLPYLTFPSPPTMPISSLHGPGMRA